MKFIPLIILSLLLIAQQAQTVTLLPRKLSESDRSKATQILGFGTMMRLLSNPYPLGGYDGVEIGLSAEYIPLDGIAKLGDKIGDDGDYNYLALTIGKGLFNNVDAFLQFSPMPQSEGISTFGGQMRWGFYETNFFPFSLSLILNGGGSSFSSLINSTTLGADIVAAVSMKNVALYFGVGRARSVTTFIGGANGITDDGVNHKVSLIESHAFFGLHLKLDKFFVAMQVDRYVESSYSGKIGLRF